MDNILSLETEMELDYYCHYWDYYYEDYDWPYDDEREPCWGYVESTEPNYDLISKHRGRYSKLNHSRVIGKMINMDTIYSKEILREKKINQILGLEYDYRYNVPTMADIFPKNND